MSNPFPTIFAYHAWANADLINKLAELEEKAPAAAYLDALRLASHSHVVARIFSGHLTGAQHGYVNDNVDPLPLLETLRTQMAAIDTWYNNYVAEVSEQDLLEPIRFTFTDGDRGCMTRQEMLMHVALHGGYHRGEIGQMLRRANIAPLWDTVAVHLHQADPARRKSASAAPA
ncbi:putative damage-inducible protein DinB [Rhizobium sp. SG_E_25_P2]|uniref:DinB family protein n=1 Tax=Rhizobium sp. SG_E_25_P2 TaxID=2879942 RepID=UPI0024742469|nr:DinB family protein [Rhizobium sp. SG_E_25_P2]MDH6269210.1 putative damage-inducible protein DinB [Rhizobium sp. SG_E_25_P2]